MAPITAFKPFALFLVLALFSVAVSAQEFAPESSPAPAPDAGAAGSVSCSAAMIVCGSTCKLPFNVIDPQLHKAKAF
ncbi:hypothetical protein CR513_58693, partial [Mucuna pruriens]